MACKDCLHFNVCNDFGLITESYYKKTCAEFENRGNWICLPENIGKLVYAIAEPCGGCPHYDELPTEENTEACRKCRKRKVICVNFDYDLIPEWGKTVFATKKEAEDAFAKMKFL